MIVNKIIIDDFVCLNSVIVIRYVIIVVDLIGWFYCYKFFINEKLLIMLEVCGFGFDFV